MSTPQIRSRLHDSCQAVATAGLAFVLAVPSSLNPSGDGSDFYVAMIERREHLGCELGDRWVHPPTVNTPQP